MSEDIALITFFISIIILISLGENRMKKQKKVITSDQEADAMPYCLKCKMVLTKRDEMDAGIHLYCLMSDPDEWVEGELGEGEL